MYAKILADSISPDGVRLTTMQVTFPRIVLAEFNTHRAFSRNSASSRAIPVLKRVADVRAQPFIPRSFTANQRGMQGSDLDALADAGARERWKLAAQDAVFNAARLADIGVHKQHANRLLEPFSWHTVIVTATDWRNFFALRCSELAQPEIRTIAEMMRDAMAASEPAPIAYGHWHLPLVHDVDVDEIVARWDALHAAKVSSARCARVSYLTHDGTRDISADLELAHRLAHDGHMSPFEHAARPATRDDCFNRCRDLVGGVPVDLNGDARVPHPHHLRWGNFRGWIQLRWMMPDEAVFGGGEP